MLVQFASVVLLIKGSCLINPFLAPDRFRVRRGRKEETMDGKRRSGDKKAIEEESSWTRKDRKNG